MQFAPIAGQPQLLFDIICLKMRAGTELTYARHAPNTLMTATGKSMARIRAARTRRFYRELFEEWAEVGLGAFKLQKKGCRNYLRFRCPGGLPLRRIVCS